VSSESEVSRKKSGSEFQTSGLQQKTPDCVCVTEAGATTIAPGGTTRRPPPVVPDPVVPVLGRCGGAGLLCRDHNSHCVNGTCVCLSAFYHDPATDLCRQ